MSPGHECEMLLKLNFFQLVEKLAEYILENKGYMQYFTVESFLFYEKQFFLLKMFSIT